MYRRTFLLLSAGFVRQGALWAQDPAAATVRSPVLNPIDNSVVFFCPMDHDVRSNTPGNCARCGMKLVSGIPEPAEYHMDMTVSPKPPRVGQKATLTFEIHDPWKNNPVKKFLIVHEKLFHAFIVGQDLQFFLHDHPVYGLDGELRYTTTFPRRACIECSAIFIRMAQHRS